MRACIFLRKPITAFPVQTNTATVSSSTPNMITDVRYYGHGHGGAAAAGIIGGLAAGAIIGSAAANNGYYYGSGSYAYEGESYAYAPGPVYVAPSYRGNRGYYGGGSARVGPATDDLKRSLRKIYDCHVRPLQQAASLVLNFWSELGNGCSTRSTGTPFSRLKI